MSIRYAKVLNPARSSDLRLIPGRYKTFFTAPKHPDRLWLDTYLKGKRVRRPDREARHSPLSTAEVNNT